MKNINNILVGGTLLALTFLGSCKKDDNCVSDFDYSDEVEEEQYTYFLTSLEFYSNPIISTCETHKSAIADYIDALNGQRNCAKEANQEGDLNQDIAELQTEFNELVCNNIVLICNYTAAVQDEISALNAAAIAWAADPNNAAMCQAYKGAAQAYLSELQANVECATLAGQEAEIQADINGAQAIVDSTQC